MRLQSSAERGFGWIVLLAFIEQDFDWICLDFGWIGVDFGWIGLGLGWIWLGFCTFDCFS